MSSCDSSTALVETHVFESSPIYESIAHPDEGMLVIVGGWDSEGHQWLTKNYFYIYIMFVVGPKKE